MTLLVGVAPGGTDRSPVDLGAALARLRSTGLRLVSVVPEAWPTPVAREGNPEYAAWARERGVEAAREARELAQELAADIPVEVSWEHGRSVGSGLLTAARRYDAQLVVVGSGSHGAWGRAAPGSTADRLLHASPVPVALAPRGYRAASEDGGPPRIHRATCAFRGDAASRRTLRRTAEICARTGADLRVATFAVRGRTMYPPSVSGGEQMVHEQWIQQARLAQREAVAELDAAGLDVEVSAQVIGVGPDWGRALDSIHWSPGDVLVIGSSPERVVERIFLGSSATKIVREAPVPVIVVQ